MHTALAAPLTQQQLDHAVAFHGHHCPGLSFGLRAAAWAVEGFGRAMDEDIVTITETDMCAVDAIQALVGCTFGKGNLVHRPYGKVAFSFYRRRDQKSARLVQRPDFRERHVSATPALSPEEARQNFIAAILAAPFADLFLIKEVNEPMPQLARLHPTLVCACCGEGVMEPCARLRQGALVCLSCAD